MPVAAPGPLVGLLSLVQTRLPSQPSVRAARLAALLDELAALILRLTPEARDRMDASSVAGHIGAILGDEQGEGALSDAALRDLSTLVRRVRCEIACASSPAGSERLSLQELAVGYAPIELVSAIRMACDGFGPVAGDRNVHLRLELPDTLPVEVDLAKIEVVIVTLLFNALKHTPRGGHVECSVTEIVQQDEVVVRISDSGPGIPASLVETLLDHGRGIDRSAVISLGPASAQQHTLGLAIARDLLAVHGGTLVLSSNEAGNVAFEARLPRFAPRGAIVSSNPPQPSGLGAQAGALAAAELRIEDEVESRPIPNDDRPLVLIVSQSRSMQRSLAQCLEPECRTAAVLDVRTGAEHAAALRPDAIVLDLLRETIDGSSWIRALRGGPACDAAVLALTAGHDPSVVVRLLDAGAQDVLATPLSLPEALARVRQLLMAKRVRDLLAHAVGRRDADLVQLAREVDHKQQALEETLAELEKARTQAERASQIKSNFLRMMSHELKTPITAIQLHLRVLERDPTVPSTERLRDGIERIGRSTRRLLHLADTVIEWARVESGRCRPTIEQVDALALVADVAQELGSYARQKQLSLVLTPTVASASISTDRRLAQLLIAGLVTRAIQVSDSGDVEITVDRNRDGLRVAVRDSAPPIPRENQAEIFDPMPFAQDLHRRTGAGSGLGLHVVRDLALALHGDVVLESVASGNTFVLQLPDAQREASGSGEHRPLNHVLA